MRLGGVNYVTDGVLAAGRHENGEVAQPRTSDIVQAEPISGGRTGLLLVVRC